LCPVLQEGVRAAITAAQDAAGDRHDVAPLVERAAGGNEGAALLRCFDDDNPEGDPADQPVPERKVLREGRRARTELADQSPIPDKSCPPAGGPPGDRGGGPRSQCGKSWGRPPAPSLGARPRPRRARAPTPPRPDGARALRQA